MTALEAVDALAREELPTALTRIVARLLEPAPAPAPVEILTVEETAHLLKTDKRWVYKHARELGGTRLTSRKLRFTRARVLRYVETRK